MSIQVTDPAIAYEIIRQAKDHGVYPGEFPTDPQECIRVAQQNVDMAQQAKDQGMEGPPILAVLNAAQAAPAAPQAAAPAAPANPYGQPPAAPQAPAPSPQPQQSFAPQPPQPAAEQLPPIPTPAPPAPAAAPAESAPIDPSQYGSVEPWPGYKGAKIADIMENLENIFRNQGDRAREKLAHVWGYESAQARPRQRLLRKLQEIAENGISPDQAPAPVAPQPPAPPAPQAAPQPAPQQPGVDPTPPFAQPPTPVAPQPPVQTHPVAAPVVPPTPVAPSTPTATAPEFSGDLPSPMQGGATQKALEMVARENLPIPQSIPGDIPVLPSDFTGFSDVQVRQFQSMHNAFQARAHHLVAVAEGYASDAKTIADAEVRRYLNSLGDVKVTVTQVEAQAAQIPEVAAARQVQHEWSEVARQFKALRDTYQWNCERLSREQTARDNEKSTVR